MDVLLEVEEIVVIAVKWGYKVVVIMDYGNVQFFLYGYKAVKKVGIQLIYGMEVNIVEDCVFIVYNEVEMDLLEVIYVVFDVEMIGFLVIYNDLIQVAVFKMYKGNVIVEFDEFINFGYFLLVFIIELIGIIDDYVKNVKLLE